MKICVIGTGYVGLVVGTCLADMGNTVICVDNNSEKIEKLKNGIVPIFEPGLEELIRINVKENRLTFSTNLKDAVQKSLVCFIAVSTPQTNEGKCDLTAIYDVVNQIALSINEYKVIVDKSTVPIGTGEKIKQIISEKTQIPFDLVSNPEFLKQGAAVNDFLYPDRVIIGTDSDKALNIMKEIYSHYLRSGNQLISMDIKSAEMTKYVANAFLATKISFINEMANICEKVGADIEQVRKGIISDPRIGNKFLFPGIGYGGSCFPKDVNALIEIAKNNNTSSKILEAVRYTNLNQKEIFLSKILNFYNGNIKDKVFTVWGLSFKPKTNDMREAPSVYIINKLLELGAKIIAYDPQAMENAKAIFHNSIIYAPSAYSAIQNSHALILLTEWNEFRKIDVDFILENLSDKVIFDARNQYSPEVMKKIGIKYINFGLK